MTSNITRGLTSGIWKSVNLSDIPAGIHISCGPYPFPNRFLFPVVCDFFLICIYYVSSYSIYFLVNMPAALQLASANPSIFFSRRRPPSPREPFPPSPAISEPVQQAFTLVPGLPPNGASPRWNNLCGPWESLDPFPVLRHHAKIVLRLTLPMSKIVFTISQFGADLWLFRSGLVFVVAWRTFYWKVVWDLFKFGLLFIWGWFPPYLAYV